MNKRDLHDKAEGIDPKEQLYKHEKMVHEGFIFPHILGNVRVFGSEKPFEPLKPVKYISIRCDNCGQEHEINVLEEWYNECSCGGLYTRIYQ